MLEEIKQLCQKILIFGAGAIMMILIQIILLALFVLTFLQQEEKIKELL